MYDHLLCSHLDYISSGTLPVGALKCKPKKQRDVGKPRRRYTPVSLGCL